MSSGFEKGDRAYIVVSNVKVEECEVLSCDGMFCVLRFAGHEGPTAARLGMHRVFRTKEEAAASMPRRLPN